MSDVQLAMMLGTMVGLVFGAWIASIRLQPDTIRPVEKEMVRLARKIEFDERFIDRDSGWRSVATCGIRVNGCWYDVRISSAARIDA